MNKFEWISRRTRIIIEMLDNPGDIGICATTKCFAELDDLYDEIAGEATPSEAQSIRDREVAYELKRQLREAPLDSLGAEEFVERALEMERVFLKVF